MLVLSRRVGEELVIGGNITIKVVSVQGGKVRLAVTAPPKVTVDRAEIHERRVQFAAPIDNENVMADVSLTCSNL